MNRISLGLFLLLVVPVEAQWQERADWVSFFDEADVRGTIAVIDERGGTFRRLAYNLKRAEQRFTPASTFKIPHSLFALDSGIIRDDSEHISWDGKRRWLAAWNSDQTLRSALRNSAVWVYQAFAKSIGAEREQEYLLELDYGNAEMGVDVDLFWLDGSLRISALEQVAFLRSLYSNALPFSIEHQRLVKDIMVVESSADAVLRAKTGWGISPDPDIGWWVGWVETFDGVVFFALNIDIPNGQDDAPKRTSVVRAILDHLDAL